MADPIPWHRRLEARAFAGAALLLAGSLLTLSIVTADVIRRHSFDRAGHDLASADAAVQHLLVSRAELAASQARLVTALPVFRAHMTDARLAGDGETMHAMADMYRQELTAAFTIVTDANGRWLASAGLPAATPAPSGLAAVVDDAARGRSRREIVALGGRLYLLAAEPAMFGVEILGTLASGYALDGRFALDLAASTGREVAVMSGDDVSGTSLAEPVRTALARVLQTPQRLRNGVREPAALVRLGSSQFVAAAFPLRLSPEAPAAGTLVILEDWAPTEAFIASIQSYLLVAGSMLFLAAGTLAALMSRRLSRPLRELARVAGDIAAGHWDRRVTATTTAEAALMATAFNDMTASLSHWHAQAVQREAQLQTSYERFRAVTHSVHDAIVSTDADGAILFWHPRAAALFGLTEQEAAGRRFDTLLADEWRGRYLVAAARLTGDEAQRPAAITVAGHGLRLDGSTFPLELTLAAWRSITGLCLTAVVRDVTERADAETQLRDRERQLREAQKMDAVGRLASGIAHDVNNSLMVIQGHAELVSGALPADHPALEDVARIVNAATSAAGVTRRLLTFGRRHEQDARVIDPREVVAGVQKVMGRLLGDHISVVTRIADDAGHVCVDPDQLEQVIMNLAINARDAMPTGGTLRLSVDAGTREGRDVVTVAVADTGTGMTAETAARVFEPFFTTKAEGQGTGLGLSIVYGIVTQHGGQVDLETAPGRGTTFLLHLPRVAAPAAAAAAPAAPPVQPGHETVLMADDKPMLRRMLRKALEAGGYTVLEAEHGDAALEVARAHAGDIHLFLTDVMMPGLGSRDLQHAMLQLRPGIRIVFMSGHPPGSDARAHVDQSGWPCLQKPFSFERLSEVIRSSLEDHRAA